MKYPMIAASIAVSLVATLAFTIPVHAANVGISINIGQPGFYGHIDIGDFSRPQLIYQQPRVMYRSAMHRPPIYLHVPPGHAKDWRRHCREYNACNERVYFVRDDWYRNEYVPRYQERHAVRHDGRRDDRRDGPDNGRRDDSRRDNDHRDDNRRGNDRNDNDRHDSRRGNGPDR